MTVFGVSQRQENKENPSCQCDSDLENPEKGKSWLPASKGAGLLQAGIEEALALSVLAAEFLLFSLTEVLGIHVVGCPAILPLVLKAGRWQDPWACFDWPPEDTATDAKITY